jgi:hypothetical protein
MIDHLIEYAKWVVLALAALVMDNSTYIYLVALTFAFNYWYRQKNAMVLTHKQWIKLFFMGALVSIAVFDALEGQILRDSPRVGAAAFLTALSLEIFPILIDSLKEATPAIVRKRTGVKKDD